MFFWARHKGDGDYFDDDIDDVDLGEPLEFDTPVVVLGDPKQSIQPLGDVLNGSRIRVIETLPANIIIGRTESVEYNYSSNFDLLLTPPSAAEKILLLILSRSDRQTLLGDLAEEWREIKARHGLGFANKWYWEQTILSFWPLFRKGFRWGAIAGLGELIRRLIS